MTKTKFGANQRVSVMGSRAFPAPPGPYTIIAVLPLERGLQQYRVRSSAENFERIFDEMRLKAVSYD